MPLTIFSHLLYNVGMNPVLGLFYETNGGPATSEQKIAVLTRAIGAKISFFGNGGEVTADDKVGMLEDEYLIKFGFAERPSGC